MCASFSPGWPLLATFVPKASQVQWELRPQPRLMWALRGAPVVWTCPVSCWDAGPFRGVSLSKTSQLNKQKTHVMHVVPRIKRSAFFTSLVFFTEDKDHLQLNLIITHCMKDLLVSQHLRGEIEETKRLECLCCWPDSLCSPQKDFDSGSWIKFRN